MRYFVGNPDTFGGNSGSGVFDDAHALIGVLVRGGEDYVQRAATGCYQVDVADPIDTGGEEIVRAPRDERALRGRLSERARVRCEAAMRRRLLHVRRAQHMRHGLHGRRLWRWRVRRDRDEHHLRLRLRDPDGDAADPPVTSKHYGACTVHGDGSDRDAGGDERSAWTSAFVLVVALALLRNLRFGRGRLPLRDVG